MRKSEIVIDIGAKIGNRIYLGDSRDHRNVRMWVMQCQCGNISLATPGTNTKNCHKCANKINNGSQIGPSNKSWKGSKYISATEYNRWKNSAIRRKIKWLIDYNDLDNLLEKQQFKCAYTGETLNISHGKTTTKGNASLDRINSNLPYASGNIQFVTKMVNISKQTFTHDEFIAMCLKITNYVNK